ncbi:MAG: FMN-binding glutamate synthase family protein [Clostridia bacterium]|jgi:glutamate synthase domain-containing protein 2|nr:FMN-binding glutamate synthase family protein [Clostridia bacterium]
MVYKDKDLYKAFFGSALLTCLGVYLLGRPLMNHLSDSFSKIIMTDPYNENLWEFYSAAKRTSLQTIVETNLRSQEGKLLSRPFGSPKKFPNTNDLMFSPAQLNVLPTAENVPVDTKVILGPQAYKPLVIEMPIIVSGMAFSLALTEKAKIALAQGASLAGTATNSGEGPYLPAERAAADRYILQYDRGDRNHEAHILQQADMIEIQIGQGGIGGIGHATVYKDLPPKARRLLHLDYGQEEITHAHVSGVKDPEVDLPLLINRLRDLTGGVPIGVKIAAGQSLEKDLQILIDSGTDFIALDCAEAATKGSPPILQDDFGVPLVYAVNRAANYLKSQGVKDKITLLAGGGLFTPGAFLKALALGADAVYIGSIALFAMAHTQVLKALPWEPPTQVVWAQSRYGHKLNIKKGAQNLANFLHACNEEIKEGVRAMGKTSIRDVRKEDLFSLDPLLGQTIGVPSAFESCLDNRPGKMTKKTGGLPKEEQGIIKMESHK